MASPHYKRFHENGLNLATKALKREICVEPAERSRLRRYPLIWPHPSPETSEIENTVRRRFIGSCVTSGCAQTDDSAAFECLITNVEYADSTRWFRDVVMRIAGSRKLPEI